MTSQERGSDERAAGVLARVVFALIGLYLVVAVAQRVALFADGSYWFLSILLEGGVQSWNPRWSSYTILSAPTILAAWSGVRNVTALEVVFGVGMYGHFAIMMIICARAAARRRHLLIFPAASFFLVSANMGFWPHTGSHVMVSLFWSLLFVLMLPSSHTVRWLVLAISLAVLSTSAFESMLFFGPVLATAAVWRFRVESNAAQRRGSVVVAALCLLGSASAVMGILTKGPGHFSKSAVVFVDGAGRVHGLLLLSLMAFALVLTAETKREVAWRVSAALLATGCVGWIAACLLSPSETISVSLHHDIRTFNLWFTLALAALFMWSARVGFSWSAARRLRSWRVVSLVALTQTVWLVLVSVHWQHYLVLIDREVRTGAGIRSFESTALAQGMSDGRILRPFSWGWTVPLLSVLAAPNGDVQTIIANPTWYTGWTPFDIADPAALAPLERYGFRFASYRSAIAKAAAR